jgi:cytochrome c-type biogenesis protein CcmF
VNNLILAVSTFVVFIGTIWPLIAEMFFDRTLSVGPPFFDAAFTPFRLRRIAVALPIGAMLPWKRAGALKALPRAGARRWCWRWPAGSWPGRCSAASPRLRPIGVGCRSGWWLGAHDDLWSRTGRGDLGHRLGRLTRLPRADWGKTIAHAGSASPCSVS